MGVLWFFNWYFGLCIYVDLEESYKIFALKLLREKEKNLEILTDKKD
jgi:hypothetical protein